MSSSGIDEWVKKAPESWAKLAKKGSKKSFELWKKKFFEGAEAENKSYLEKYLTEEQSVSPLVIVLPNSLHVLVGEVIITFGEPPVIKYCPASAPPEKGVKIPNQYAEVSITVGGDMIVVIVSIILIELLSDLT
jgi:hypothetical protein